MSLTSLGCFASLIAVARTQFSNPALKYWSYSLLSAAIAHAMILLNTYLPFYVIIIICNFLAVICYTSLWYGLTTFYHAPVRKNVVVSALAITFLCIAFFSYYFIVVTPSLPIRVILLRGISLVLSCLSLHAIFKYGRKRNSHKFLFCLISLNCFSMLAKIGYITMGGTPSLQATSLTLLFHRFWSGMFIVGLTLCLISISIEYRMRIYRLDESHSSP